jgi:hypothetical protein
MPFVDCLNGQEKDMDWPSTVRSVLKGKIDKTISFQDTNSQWSVCLSLVYMYLFYLYTSYNEVTYISTFFPV